MRRDDCPCCQPAPQKREARVWALARALCYGARPPPPFISKIRHALRVERTRARARLRVAAAQLWLALEAKQTELEQSAGKIAELEALDAHRGEMIVELVAAEEQLAATRAELEQLRTTIRNKGAGVLGRVDDALLSVENGDRAAGPERRRARAGRRLARRPRESVPAAPRGPLLLLWRRAPAWRRLVLRAPGDRAMTLCEQCGGTGSRTADRNGDDCARCQGSGIEHPMIAELEARVLALDAALTKLTADRDRDLKRAGEDVDRLWQTMLRVRALKHAQRPIDALLWLHEVMDTIEKERGKPHEPAPDGTR